MKQFQYHLSRSVVYWGCAFDSVLELKYAVSIHREYEFLREHPMIYYRHSTLSIVDQLTEGVLRYTPDFLIRHKVTGEAYLVEIKPRAFEGQPQLEKRKQVAENYIRYKKLDWKYKVVFDDEIVLTAEDELLFQKCCVFKYKNKRTKSVSEQRLSEGIAAPFFLKAIPTNAQVEFVLFGTRKSKSGWGDRQ